MILDADNMHQMIGNQINNVHKEALGNFNNVFSSIKQYAEDIQTQQSKERPVDFNKRPIPENEKKVSKGVPLESDLWFESLKRFGFAKVNNTTHKHKSIKKKNIDAIYGIIDDKTKLSIKLLHFNEKASYRLSEMEGSFRANPYSDKTGKEVIEYDKKEGPTIGYGHYIDKEEWEKYKNCITKEQAVKLKQQDLQDFEKIVKDEFKDTKLTQNQYDALVMRAYNGGGIGAYLSMKLMVLKRW